MFSFKRVPQHACYSDIWKGFTFLSWLHYLALLNKSQLLCKLTRQLTAPHDSWSKSILSSTSKDSGKPGQGLISQPLLLALLLWEQGTEYFVSSSSLDVHRKESPRPFDYSNSGQVLSLVYGLCLIYCLSSLVTTGDMQSDVSSSYITVTQSVISTKQEKELSCKHLRINARRILTHAIHHRTFATHLQQASWAT